MDDRTTKMSSIFIPQQNRQIVLEIVRQNPRISRKELSTITGMSPSLVSKICSELLDKKLIREIGIGHSSGGRRPVYIEMNHNAFYLLGIYLSSNALNITICDFQGNIKAQYKNELSTEDFLSGDMLQIAHEYERKAGYSCRGIGFAAEDPVFFDHCFSEKVGKLSETTTTLALRSCHAALIGLNRVFSSDYYQNSIYIHFGKHTYGAVMNNGVVLDGRNVQIGSAWNKIPYLSKIEADLLSGRLSDEETAEFIIRTCDLAHAVYSVDMVFVDIFDDVFSKNMKEKIAEKLLAVRDYNVKQVLLDTVFQRGVVIELARRINYGV